LSSLWPPRQGGPAGPSLRDRLRRHV